mgnify:FL=1|jgi:hypothetical protein
MNTININLKELLNKEVTVYYGTEKEVQGLITKIDDLGISLEFSKIKDDDVLNYKTFNNTIFISFNSVRDVKIGLHIVDDEEKE